MIGFRQDTVCFLICGAGIKMTSMAEIEKEWYSPKAAKREAEFLAAFENALKHCSICRLPIPDADLAMATRIFDNAAKHLAAKGQRL